MLVFLTFMARGQVPSILEDPADLCPSLGGDAKFRAKVSQSDGVGWYYTDGVTTSPLLGETSRGVSKLTVSNVQASDVGGYYLVVTNASGSATSRVAQLTIDPTFTRVREGPHVTDVGAAFWVSWGDYDQDGDADLLVGYWLLGENTLYVNNGDDSFTRVTQGIPPLSAGYTVTTWCDFDNDGRLDFFAMREAGSSVFAYNNGDGTFSQVPFDSIWSWNVSIADYDRDGLLDLYLPSSHGRNCLYRNLGNRTFQKMTAQEVGDLVTVNTYGPATWADYDDDGWPDIFAGGDAAFSEPQHLFRNNGTGAFVSVSNLVTEFSNTGFSGAWGDYDNDGSVDLAVGSFTPGEIRVFRNRGGGDFEPTDLIFPAPHCNWVAWADYDNDGFLDLAGTSALEGRKLFHNNGDGTFSQVTCGSIVMDRPEQVEDNGCACLWFDYNDDGFLDLYVPNQADPLPPNYLYVTNPNGNRWLKVKLVGTTSNLWGVGAKVRAEATYAGQARWQRRDIMAGDFYNGHSYMAHFGLGDAETATTLRIEWPSGLVQQFADVPADQLLTVVEGRPMLSHSELAPDGMLRFQLHGGLVGKSYVTESSLDLTNWVPVSSNAGPTALVTVPRAPGAGGSFLRVKEQ